MGPKMLTEQMQVLICVAVYEYANGTSAHDTVLEHRFSPT